MSTTASATETVTAASVITLVQGIERVGPAAPAAIASRAPCAGRGSRLTMLVVPLLSTICCLPLPMLIRNGPLTGR